MPGEFEKMKSRSVAILMSERNLMRVSSGIGRMSGKNCRFWPIDGRLGERDLLDALKACRVDGIISEPGHSKLELLVSLGKPLALAPLEVVAEGIGRVFIDEYEVGAMAGEHLRNVGYSSLAYMGVSQSKVSMDCRDGFLNAARSAKVSCSDWKEKIARNSVVDLWGRKRLKELEAWLGSLPKPVGIFVESVELAWTALQACTRLGIGVPGQVGLVTSSDVTYPSCLASPAFSEVDIPWEDIGYEVARVILRMIDEPNTSEKEVKVSPRRVLQRGSTDRLEIGQSLFKRATALMETELEEFRTVDWLCDRLGVERRSLERAFRAGGAVSPKAHWVKMKLQRAKELMESDPFLGIAEVAYACGFPNVDRFAKPFRQMMGKSPSEYRAQLRDLI